MSNYKTIDDGLTELTGTFMPSAGSRKLLRIARLAIASCIFTSGWSRDADSRKDAHATVKKIREKLGL